MERQEIFTGKTPEEAIEEGLAKLGVAREDAEIEILEQGKKGFLNIGSVPAQVKITVKPRLTDGQRAVAFLEGLFDRLGVEAIPTLKEEDERIVIELDAQSTKGVIGRRGEMIDAIQTLAGAVANTGRKEYKRVVVDCGNYREDREETLKHVAEKLAAKAVRLGKRVRLEPMNPYERRIIHAALVDNPDVTTKSEGKEPMRFVVIIPKNLRQYDRDRRNGGGGKRYDRGGKDRRDRNNYDRGKKYDRGGRDRYGDRKPYPKRELPAEDTPQTSGTSLKSGGNAGYRKGGFSGFFGTYLGNSRDGESENPASGESATPESFGTPQTPDEE